MVGTNERSTSYGQGYRLSFADKFGVWLSSRKIRASAPAFDGLSVADIGCGYDAVFTRSILHEVRQAFAVDVALADDLKTHPKVTAIEGLLPDVLQGIDSRSLDLVVCNNVIEHLWKPLKTLNRLHNIVATGGTVFINVPSWRGKRLLEFSAFRLGMSPVTEMNDHKMYYDPRDLWPLLVQAGFVPQRIRIGTHKFGLNTYAVCQA